MRFWIQHCQGLPSSVSHVPPPRAASRLHELPQLQLQNLLPGQFSPGQPSGEPPAGQTYTCVSTSVCVLTPRWACVSLCAAPWWLPTAGQRWLCGQFLAQCGQQQQPPAGPGPRHYSRLFRCELTAPSSSSSPRPPRARPAPNFLLAAPPPSTYSLPYLLHLCLQEAGPDGVRLCETLTGRVAGEACCYFRSEVVVFAVLLSV